MGLNLANLRSNIFRQVQNLLLNEDKNSKFNIFLHLH